EKSDQTDGQDDMSDDQQAALDQIMAEIETKKDPEPETETKTEAQSPEKSDQTDGQDDMSDDQQAALDQIMAEIETKKDPEPETESALVEEESGQNNDFNLSMDDFNKELTELLSAKKTDEPEVKPETAPQTSAKATAQIPETTESLQDVNKALKDIVNKEKDPEKPSASEKKDTNLSEKDEKFPILKEVTVNEKPSKSKRLNKKSAGNKIKPSIDFKKVAKYCGVAAVFAAVGVGVFWGYQSYRANSGGWRQSLFSNKKEQAAEKQLQHQQPEDDKENSVAKQFVDTKNQLLTRTQEQTVTASSNLLEILYMDIISAREELVRKMQDIKELKAYYQQGIDEEFKKLEIQINKKNVTTLEAALQDSTIELSLRTIRRRMAYIDRLAPANDMLVKGSEKLLYLQRQTKMYGHLYKHISGFPIMDYKNEVEQILEKQLEAANNLSIDDFYVPVASIKSIWKDFDTAMANKKNKRFTAMKSQKDNNKISKNICKGLFDHKNKLTAITADTAGCLAKWTGKDLYLNSLTELPAEAAKQLSRWPGEWLSLNGLTHLSAESAKYLAQWPGKRMSLNGLMYLSTKATFNLSKWRGEQLEMIGLKSLGKWENYGTRLFLSQTLQQRLEGR
ncbi:MAG: hypothetical protein GY874_01745, partial [Desulfobacteraceae bacterium]|nr:hypothetical protein [Desulfobacteraceae bacterium]